ncbi:MAG: hypothetical protein KDC87_08005 [Planctomycetes bacterium]|nr:hypothetical protein [Planctomycetota bacterium]MCB9871049.1 hypothetical protein [Planctomycetota bacterium]
MSFVRTIRCSRIFLLASLAPWACAALLAAQKGERSDPKKPTAKDAAHSADPYTQGDEALMKQAGYVSFGPFQFGDDHGTGDMRKMMPETKLLFVETKHFKIASALPAYKMPKDSKARRELVKELGELKKILPKVNTRVRALDRWLRLHLLAFRAEQQYAAVQKVLGVTDADFPAKEIRFGQKFRGEYRGEGPYLGMTAKFTVLITDKDSDLGRYARKIGHTPIPNEGIGFYFTKIGSYFVGAPTTLKDGLLTVDHALHCYLVYAITLQLLDGYKGYRFRMPRWVVEGIALWFNHALDPREHHFCTMKGGLPSKQFDHRWAQHVRGLVKNGAAPPLRETMKHFSTGGMEFIDLMCCWSRIDYLLAKRPKELADFMRRAKDPIDPGTGKIASPERVLKQQSDAFRSAFGYDPDAFDRAWSAYVLKSYPR